MPKLTGWWERRSDPARFELYTRWSLYSFALIEVFLVLGAVERSDSPIGARVVLWALLGQAVLCAVLVSRVLDWALGRRERPTRLLAAVGATTALAVLVVVVLRARGTLLPGGEAVQIVSGFTAFAIGPAVLNIRRPRRIVLLVVGTAALVAMCSAAAGLPGGETTGYAVAVAAGAPPWRSPTAAPRGSWSSCGSWTGRGRRSRGWRSRRSGCGSDGICTM